MLVLLGLSRIDPIVWAGNPAVLESVRHGLPRFSSTGSLIWLGVLGIYAAVAIAVGAHVLALPKRYCLVRGAPLLLLLSTLWVAVVHPVFLLTLLSPSARDGYSRFVEAWVPILDQIYFHWGLMSFRYHILLVQVLMACGVVLFLFALRHHGTDRRHQAR